MLLRPFALGAFIGIAPAVTLYFTVPAYAAFINWQFSHPLVLIPAAVVGLAVGWLID